MEIRPYKTEDIAAMRLIWNDVVRADDAFPQVTPLKDEKEAEAFFAGQDATTVAVENSEVVGLAILHPNGSGHTAGNANASYAVRKDQRGRHIGEALVKDSIDRARALGYHNLQFNAVLASNRAALHLYAKLGFRSLGILKQGYRHSDGQWEDLRLFVYPLYDEA